MLQDIGADEYKIEEDNNKEYLLKIGVNNNKINLNINTRDTKQFKNYSGEFTLEDLRRINKVFLLTQSIYEAKEEFKKAVERKKIAISEKDDYVHTVFYMMIGTDTSTLSVALPRDETPRIIRLEQNINILKIGRDNLNDRLAVFEREAEEIKRDLDTIQMGNTNLHQIADTIGQGIPDVSEILHDYKAGKKVQNYSSYNQVNTQNEFPDQPYSSYGVRQPDLPYSSTGARQDFGTIKESLNEQNAESSLPNENHENDENYQLDTDKLDENPSEGDQYEKFENGILKSIIKDYKEIEIVLNKIEENFPGSVYKLLYKGSRDGDGANDFHSRCDEAEKTLVLIEDNYGNRFGGFTTQDWGGEYLQKKDDEAFIFSLDKNKIYPIIKGKNAIRCCSCCCPQFSNDTIYLNNKFLTSKCNVNSKNDNYQGFTYDYELNNGIYNFIVKELEIYHLIFE